MNSLPKQHYPNAPITEAVIDVRVEPTPGLTVARLEQLQTEAYPTREAMVSQGFQFGPGLAVARTTPQDIGFRFRSADGRNVHQARLDGFTMSRLKPYETWESFRDEARHRWQLYRELVHPRKVSRLAVRYVNRIEIPLPLDDFAEYFRTLPQVAPELPQALQSYAMQLQIPLPDLKSLAIINHILGPEQVQPEKVAIVLDIDIFRTVDVPSHEDEIWAFMEKLGTTKNQIFEASITNKARELFR